MASRRAELLETCDGNAVAYALTLATSMTLFVATTAGETIMPFVPEHWRPAVNAATAAPVFAIAIWRRWQLFAACLLLIQHAKRRR
jgi:hypothetical protein